MRASFIVLAAALGLALSGCGPSRPQTVSMPNLPQAMPVNPPGGSFLLAANLYAGDALQKMLLMRMGDSGGILTTSFVNLNDFTQTSAFGRVTAQQVGSRLSQYGYKVLEARLSNTLAMERRDGEFMLTRDARRLLAESYDANAVLVGCYTNAGSNVFVSARVVRLFDNAVIGAYEYFLPRDTEVNGLLTGNYSSVFQGGDGVWERFSLREQAFAAPEPKTSTSVPLRTKAKPVASSRSSGAKPVAAARPGRAAIPTEKDAPMVEVPRHVAPETAPVQ